MKLLFSLFLLIPCFLLIFNFNEVFGDATSWIPPTNAIQNINTTNATVHSKHWNQLFNFVGKAGLSITGSDISKTIYFSAPAGVLPPTTTCAANFGFVKYNQTSNTFTCKLLNQTGSGGTITTGQNIGTSGIGVYSGVSGTALQFLKLISGNNNCSFTGNSTNVILTCNNSITSVNSQTGPSISITRTYSNNTEIINKTNNIQISVKPNAVLTNGSTQIIAKNITSTGGITMSGSDITLHLNKLSMNDYKAQEITNYLGSLNAFLIQPQSGMTFAFTVLAPTGGNTNSRLEIMRTSDVSTNFERFILGSDVQAGGEFAIDSLKGGTGTQRPFNIYQGSTLEQSFDVAGTTTIQVHLLTLGTAPAISACGTNPSIAGNDLVGKVTIGTGVVTSCTITFASSWTNAPSCMANDESSILTVQATSTTSKITLSTASTVGGNVIKYICLGYS